MEKTNLNLIFLKIEPSELNVSMKLLLNYIVIRAMKVGQGEKLDLLKTLIGSPQKK